MKFTAQGESWVANIEAVCYICVTRLSPKAVYIHNVFFGLFANVKLHFTLVIWNTWCIYNGSMKGYRLKYVLKAIIQQKEKVLVNIFLLLLVKGGFLKSESCVYLNSDHMLNLLFHKWPEKHGPKEAAVL